uniref:RecQ-mediated genome instability protein 1 n=1 Tax=Hirondellea gigas TaxID=1518452 RepID=A0A6A7FM68_9CRUS
MDVSEKVKLFLNQKKNVEVPQVWVAACLDWLQNEHSITSQQLNGRLTWLCEKAYEQWLYTDLAELETGSLPVGITEQHNITLPKDTMMQIINVREIGLPAYSQLQQLRKDDIVNQLVDTDKPNQQSWEPKPSRMLLLKLTDGVTELKGMEYTPMNTISLQTKPGTKILVRGGSNMRRGVLLLTISNTTVLGGAVDALLVTHAPENIINRALNLEETETPREYDEAPIAPSAVVAASQASQYYPTQPSTQGHPPNNRQNVPANNNRTNHNNNSLHTNTSSNPNNSGFKRPNAVANSGDNNGSRVNSVDSSSNNRSSNIFNTRGSSSTSTARPNNNRGNNSNSLDKSGGSDGNGNFNNLWADSQTFGRPATQSQQQQQQVRVDNEDDFGDDDLLDMDMEAALLEAEATISSSSVSTETHRNNKASALNEARNDISTLNDGPNGWKNRSGVVNNSSENMNKNLKNDVSAMTGIRIGPFRSNNFASAARNSSNPVTSNRNSYETLTDANFPEDDFDDLCAMEEEIKILESQNYRNVSNNQNVAFTSSNLSDTKNDNSIDDDLKIIESKPDNCLKPFPAANKPVAAHSQSKGSISCDVFIDDSTNKNISSSGSGSNQAKARQPAKLTLSEKLSLSAASSPFQKSSLKADKQIDFKNIPDSSASNSKDSCKQGKFKQPSDSFNHSDSSTIFTEESTNTRLSVKRVKCNESDDEAGNICKQPKLVLQQHSSLNIKPMNDEPDISSHKDHTVPDSNRKALKDSNFSVNIEGNSTVAEKNQRTSSVSDTSKNNLSVHETAIVKPFVGEKFDPKDECLKNVTSTDSEAQHCALNADNTETDKRDRRKSTSTRVQSQPPFTYLCFLPTKYSTEQEFVVKGFVMTLMSRLSPSMGQWRLHVKINDGSCSVHVDIDDQVLQELIGLSVTEIKAQIAKAGSDSSIKAKFSKNVSGCQKELISLCCLMKLRVAPTLQRPLLVSLQPITQQHLQQLEERCQ